MITIHLFEPDGKVIKIQPNEIAAHILTKKSTIWVDMEQPTHEEYDLILKDTFNFHPLSIEDCQRSIELPKVDIFDEHLFLVFHNVSSESGKGHFKKLEMDFFLGPNYIVTVHLHKSKVIEELVQKINWELNSGKKRKIQRTADFILYEILDTFVDRYFPVIDAWEDKVEEIELEIIKKKSQEQTLNHLMTRKRETLSMRKSILPQREVLKKIIMPEFPFISQKNKVYFRDVYDHILRVYAAIEMQRDLLNSAFEAHRSMSSNQMNVISTNINRVMQKLTIMSAIFLPLTFITGLYGMNFEFLPGAHHPFGFFMMLGFSLLVSLVLIVYFKKNEWM